MSGPATIDVCARAAKTPPEPRRQPTLFPPSPLCPDVRRLHSSQLHRAAAADHLPTLPPQTTGSQWTCLFHSHLARRADQSCSSVRCAPLRRWQRVSLARVPVVAPGCTPLCCRLWVRRRAPRPPAPAAPGNVRRAAAAVGPARSNQKHGSTIHRLSAQLRVNSSQIKAPPTVRGGAGWCPAEAAGWSAGRHRRSLGGR